MRREPRLAVTRAEDVGIDHHVVAGDVAGEVGGLIDRESGRQAVGAGLVLVEIQARAHRGVLAAVGRNWHHVAVGMDNLFARRDASLSEGEREWLIADAPVAEPISL